MDINGVPVLVEGRRGCGYRKGGGKYLVTDPKPMLPCGRLPMPLVRCPACSAGIKPTRGWTWISPATLFRGRECIAHPCRTGCPAAVPPERAGLLWIGESFYKSPQEWLDEARRMGVSRRLSTIPRDFVLGETWVFVAHRKGIPVPCHECEGTGSIVTKRTDGTPLSTLFEEAEECEACDGTGLVTEAAIFHGFLPERIEYVCRGDETPEELDRLAERGFTLVRVQPDEEAGATAAPVHEGAEEDE